MSSLCLQICKKCVRKCLQNNGVTGYLNCMLLFCCKVLVLILPFTHNPVKRGESIIAQGKPRSGAALGMEKIGNGVRRSGAEEADSRIAPSIPANHCPSTRKVGAVTTGSLGFFFFFNPNRGCAASPLHPCLRAGAPLPGLQIPLACARSFYNLAGRLVGRFCERERACSSSCGRMPA